MTVQFLALARQEADDAFAWYDSQIPGLGHSFLAELDKAILRIERFPLSCEEIDPGLRRCLLGRFPYGVIYGLNGNRIIVVAVAHLHRSPRHWVDRD